MLLDFESGVLGVRHRDHERTLVNLIRYCLLRVAGQVDAIDLVEHGDEVVAGEAVVDRNDAHSSLLKELNVCAGDVTWNAFILSLIELAPLPIIRIEELSADGLGEYADDERRG